MLLVVGREIAVAKSVGKQATSQLLALVTEGHLPLIVGHQETPHTGAWGRWLNVCLLGDCQLPTKAAALVLQTELTT